MAFVDGQAKLANIAKLQAQLRSDPTRPLPTEIPVAAPGKGYMQYVITYVLCVCAISLGFVVGHRFYADADPGQHAAGSAPVSW